MNPHPCTPNCPRRRWDCHFEGHCPEYDASVRKKAEEKAADAARVRGQRDAYSVIKAGYDKTVRHNHDRKRR